MHVDTEVCAQQWEVIDCWLCRAIPQRGACAGKEEENEEKDEETEDDLRRAREFDEFKDGKHLFYLVNCANLLGFSEHRRGSGNRQGKG